MPKELVIFPDGGPETGLWSSPLRLWRRTDAATDVFLRLGRTVVSSVSVELEGLGELPTRVMVAVLGRSAGPDVTVQCYTRDRREAFVRVLLPRGFEDLSRGVQRATIARTLVEAAGAACGAEARDLVSRAADRARERAFVHRESSAWKWAPGRRRRARASGWLADDGFARVVVEVDDGEQIRVSAPVRGSTTAPRLARALASLRWRGSDAVQLSTGGIRIRGFGTSMEIGAEDVVLELNEDGALEHRRHDDHDGSGPSDDAGTASITVTALRDDALHVGLDCGPAEDEAARRYADTVDLYGDAIRADPEWLVWLTALEVPTIGFCIELVPGAEGREVTADRSPSGDHAGATLRTALGSVWDPRAARRQVREDVRDLVEALRALMDAPVSPVLPDLTCDDVDGRAAQA